MPRELYCNKKYVSLSMIRLLWLVHCRCLPGAVWPIGSTTGPQSPCNSLAVLVSRLQITTHSSLSSPKESLVGCDKHSTAVAYPAIHMTKPYHIPRLNSTIPSLPPRAWNSGSNVLAPTACLCGNAASASGSAKIDVVRMRPA
jgi:hypothetical protein